MNSLQLSNNEPPLMLRKLAPNNIVSCFAKTILKLLIMQDFSKHNE